MSYCGCFSTLLGLPVRCLLVHFSLGIAPLGLPVGSLLGGCRCLVELQVWCVQVFEVGIEEVHWVSGSAVGTHF